MLLKNLSASDASKVYATKQLEDRNDLRHRKCTALSVIEEGPHDQETSQMGCLKSFIIGHAPDTLQLLDYNKVADPH